MIAGIGKLPDTLRDRSIVLNMQRRKPSEQVEKWREHHAERLTDLRRRCLRWAHDYLPSLANATPAIPDHLHDRSADNWSTLLAIADVAGGPWPERAKKALHAIEQSSAGKDDDNAAILLLEDIRTLFTQRKTDRVSSEDLVEALHLLEERPWPEWGRQRKPITKRQVAQLLAPFGIRPHVIRIGDETPRGYTVADCDESFSRYLDSQSATPQQESNDATFHDFRSATEGSHVADEKAQNPASDKACCGVADEKGGTEEKTYHAGDACPQRGCIGRLKLVTGDALMCGQCFWHPTIPGHADVVSSDDVEEGEL